MQRSYYTALIGKLAMASEIDYEQDPRFNNADRELIREGVRELAFFGDEHWRGEVIATGSFEDDGELQTRAVRKRKGKPE